MELWQYYGSNYLKVQSNCVHVREALVFQINGLPTHSTLHMLGDRLHGKRNFKQ